MCKPFSRLVAIQLLPAELLSPRFEEALSDLPNNTPHYSQDPLTGQTSFSDGYASWPDMNEWDSLFGTGDTFAGE
jgi:hypothetical protein